MIIFFSGNRDLQNPNPVMLPEVVNRQINNLTSTGTINQGETDIKKTTTTIIRQTAQLFIYD